MSNPIDTFLKSIDDAVDATEGVSQQISSEYVAAMETVGKAVENWCSDNHLSQVKSVNGVDVVSSVESFDCSMLDQTIGADKIIDLCKKAHVSNEHLKAAAKRVACLLSQTMGRNGHDTFSNYNNRPHRDSTVISAESLYGAELSSRLSQTASLEVFGINMDRVEPDLKTILTIALLQFHTNLTPRVVPIQTVTQGNVTIVREAMDVYDLTDTTKKPTRVIELYKDPSMVTVRAQRIVPLVANNTAKDLVKMNGVYAFNKEINMFEMAVITGKDGWDKFNHTDLVEDNILLDGVIVKVTNSDVSGKVFYTKLVIPASRGRLTQFTNDLASTDRRLALDRFPIRITKDATKWEGMEASGETNDAAVVADSTNGLLSGEGLALELHVNCHVDRRTAMLDATAWNGGLSLKGGTKSDTEKAAKAAKFTVSIEGFTLDARYNEDNKRKTSIRAEMRRRSMSYELPTGRNFVIDSAIGQDGVVNAAARLAQLEHIGRDYNNLTIIEETLKQVHDQNVTMNNDAESQASLAAQYAAGDLVNPYVYMDTLDMTNMYGVRSADASGDIKQFVKTYLNRLTSELMLKTFFQQQLAEGAPVVFRVITSPTILGELFMVKHIHQHLETDAEGTGGVEHVVTLDNGVRLEIVTSTFDSLYNKIILIPFLANSQNSILNFGCDYDQGTLVGAISIASDGGPSYHRLFSTTRELLIPSNPMGAIITVSGQSSLMGPGDTTNAVLTVGQDTDLND